MFTLSDAKHGLGVIDEHTGYLLHAVLYEKPPTQDDLDHLLSEIQQDPELYDIVKGHDWFVGPLPSSVVEEVKEKWGDNVVYHDGSELDE